MIEFSLLGSGSAGNAVFVRAPTGKILIDNGLSLRQLQLRLERIGESLDRLAAIVVTHEHGDHVKGVGVLARKTGVPVYLTRETDANLRDIGKIPEKMYFEPGEVLRILDFQLSSFRVAHDAVDPVSFAVWRAGCQLGLATDLGHACNVVRQRLRGSHALVLESNYCPDMIQRSPYPPAIVQRIRSKHGHLSNQDMCSLLASLLHDDLQWVVAVHVSQQNNTAEKARLMAQQVLADHPAKLYVADQDEPSPLMRIESPAALALGQTA